MFLMCRVFQFGVKYGGLIVYSRYRSLNGKENFQVQEKEVQVGEGKVDGVYYLFQRCYIIMFEIQQLLKMEY